MLNQYAWWKYLIIATVVAVGLIYALPNVFGEDPAVQISPSRSTVGVKTCISAWRTSCRGTASLS